MENKSEIENVSRYDHIRSELKKWVNENRLIWAAQQDKEVGRWQGKSSKQYDVRYTPIYGDRPEWLTLTVKNNNGLETEQWSYEHGEKNEDKMLFYREYKRTSGSVDLGIYITDQEKETKIFRNYEQGFNERGISVDRIDPFGKF